MRATILGHRDIVRLSIGRIPMGPNALRYADRLLAILRAGGLPASSPCPAQQLLISIVIGFAIDETGEGGQPPAERPSPDGRGHDDPRLPRRAARATASPTWSQLAELVAAADADERFELLLDLFVDGLAQRAQAWPPPAPSGLAAAEESPTVGGL